MPNDTVTLDEFTARVVSDFIDDNWAQFVIFCESLRCDPDTISNALQGKGAQ